MPIQLDIAHIYSPGHGQSDVAYNYVIMYGMKMLAPKRQMILTMQYGNVGPGGWDPSPEKPHVLPRIQDHDAVTDEGMGPNTQENIDAGGPAEIWQSVEITPADPAFTDLIASFLIDQSDAGLRGYDVVAKFLYSYLITGGYYEGTIV